MNLTTATVDDVFTQARAAGRRSLGFFRAANPWYVTFWWKFNQAARELGFLYKSDYIGHGA